LRLSEILSLLLSFGSEVPAEELGAGERTFGLEGELEKSDDPIDGLMILYESDHSHLVTACKTYERVNFIG